MGKKAIWLILIAGIVISWPLSLIVKPAHFDKATIFYPITEQEKWNFEKRLALDTSRFKKVYYNKTTVIKERYLKNFLVMLDLNNYFFGMHPREDVSGVDYRFKYPFVTIIFLILAIKATVNNKKYIKVWLIFLAEIFLLSLMKQIDGWDAILFLPLTYLLSIGSRELNKYKFSWVINLAVIILMAIEIGRLLI
ncbi:MAG: hypothetical protein KIH89_003460 [Candidatus Shapirobacteria bacterium]|nr:hypothetical protein [Candidatus Shapirobacteria bacterium]